MEALNKKLTAENSDLRKQLEEAHAVSAENAAKAESALRKSSMLSSALETVPVGIVLAEAPGGKIFLGNSRIEEMFRHPVLKSASVEDYGEWICYHPDGRRVESDEYPLSRVIRDGEEYSELDAHYQRGDGTRFWVKIIGRPIRDEETGEVIAASVAVIDIEKERQLQREQEILIGELDHRVKNAFTVVKSIVSQSLRKDGIMEGLRDTIDRRLDAYANAHAGLIGKSWKTATVPHIVKEILGEQIEEGRVAVSGPEIELPSKHALSLSMAIYELSTNAFKYGALSTVGGKITVSWTVSDAENPQLEVHWMERGGPETVKPVRKGFGSFIIERAIAMEMRGTVSIEYMPEGLTWKLNAPYVDASQEHND